MADRIKSALKGSMGTYLLVIVLYAVFQTLVSTGNISNSLSGQLIPICAYIVMAVSLNLVVGISGELSLGHAGFMSVGAFTSIVAAAMLSSAIPNDLVRILVCMLIGGCFAAIAGIVVGVPVMRLSGDYLAIVTLAFGEIIKNVMNNLYVGLDASGLHFSMTDTASLGMVNGKILINGPQGATSIEKISTFFVGFILVMVCLIVVQNLIKSRSGRAIMAVRDNKIAAESVGINVTKYRLMAFVVSAALAGMAGCLYAMNYSSLVPSRFDYNTSILILVFVVLGGMGNIRGSIISAALLTILPEMLRAINDYRMLLYAIVLIAVMVLPNVPVVRDLIDKVKGLFRKKAPEAATEGGELND